MTNEWRDAQDVTLPLHPETDWLVNVLGEARALAFDIELSRKDAEDLLIAIAFRDDLGFVDDDGDPLQPGDDNPFSPLLGDRRDDSEPAGPVPATLDRPALNRLEIDVETGDSPRIRTRLLVDLATLATLRDAFFPDGESFSLDRIVEDEEAVVAPDAPPRILAVRLSSQQVLQRLEPLPSALIIGDGGREAPSGTVIVAVIDEGIAVANDRFRLSDVETRVEYFLDMDIELDGNGIPVPTPFGDDPFNPVDSASGRTWEKRHIDSLLESEPDEAAIYRRMGLIRPGSDQRQPHAFRATHGTHVLDTAAGYDWRDQDELARTRPIIAVQLPSRIIADRTDSEMHLALETALDFIRNKAEALSFELNGGERLLPLVVNFSFGNYAGPQDGTSAIEARIRDFLEAYRGTDQRPAPGASGDNVTQCEFVLAGGNSFQTRVNAQVRLCGGTSRELTWVVEPEDTTASYAQIWLPPTDRQGQRIKVALTPPRGAPDIKQSRSGEVLEWHMEGSVLARIYHRFDPVSRREAITLCLRPTWDRDPDAPVCPPGDWKIHLSATDPADSFDAACRIHRDDPLAYGRRAGRQSFFFDPDYEKYDPVTGKTRNRIDDDTGLVRREGTLSVYGGGTRPVVVGGYVALDGEPALYSSAGPTDNPARTGPDLVAVSDEGYARPGILASGTYSGSWVRLNGTSVAAPQVTRALADKIAIGEGYLQVVAMAEMAEAMAAGTTSPDQRPGPGRIGAGRMKKP